MAKDDRHGTDEINGYKEAKNRKCMTFSLEEFQRSVSYFGQ